MKQKCRISLFYLLSFDCCSLNHLISLLSTSGRISSTTRFSPSNSGFIFTYWQWVFSWNLNSLKLTAPSIPVWRRVELLLHLLYSFYLSFSSPYFNFSQFLLFIYFLWFLLFVFSLIYFLPLPPGSPLPHLILFLLFLSLFVHVPSCFICFLFLHNLLFRLLFPICCPLFFFLPLFVFSSSPSLCSFASASSHTITTLEWVAAVIRAVSIELCWPCVCVLE